jgi:uncharacterized protein (TIGR00156 family)
MKLALPFAASLAAAFAAHAQPGGFKGPDAREIVTVAAATDLPDDSGVRLVGYIVEAIGSARYRFRDDTGEVVVAIGRDGWRGLEVTPEVRIEIVGEVDRDREILENGRLFKAKVEIEVDAVSLAD